MRPLHEYSEHDIRRIAVLALIALAIFLTGTLCRQAILGSGTQVNLKTTDELSGPIALTLAGAAENTNTPSGADDFKLANTRFFDNHNWAVTTIVPTKINTDKATAVLHKQDGIFRLVLGPGTAFDGTELDGLPNDVAKYLNLQGLVYVPGN